MGILICAVIMAVLVAGTAHADPRGLWLTEGGKSHVRLYDCKKNPDRLCGVIVWLKNPRKDVENDDEELRDRDLLGTLVVWNLEHEGGGEWDDGSIYNPTDGETYDSELVELDADTLEVSGCVWFICKEQTWHRLPNSGGS